MINALQGIAVVFALFAISRTYLRMRESKLSIGQFIFWTILWIGVVLLTFMPDMINILADTLGIRRPIDVVVYFSIVLLFYLIFRLYVKISDTEREISQLVSAVAINRKKK